ncbi:MAG TPA: hypothetical protein VH760_04410 [Gaiellaceae bacterium]
MNITLDARARLLLLVLLFVLAAGVAGFMAVTRMHGSSDSEPAAVPAPATHAPAAKPHVAKSAAKPHAAPAKHRAAAKAPARPAAKPKPASPNELPVAIRRALADDQVVVVALYDPRAKIDGTALAEAKAGAKLAGSSFVPIDVRGRGVDSLNAKYGAVQDPAVIVLRPPDSLFVRIDGFADRDTVAQAAVNAAS